MGLRQGIQTHSPPVLHYPYARHPGYCHVVTAPSAHHTTPPRQCLRQWLDAHVGPQPAPVQQQLWDSALLKQWAAAIATPSLLMACMGLAKGHDMGTEFI